MAILDIPLMQDNITRHDLDQLISYLQKPNPRLTHGPEVEAFEREWSEWLGVKYSVFVNSGNSANVMTMAALRHLYGPGEVIVPTLTWVSDITSVLHAGLTPVFVDLDPKNLAMNDEQVLDKISPKTRAVFLTHILGFNGLSDRLLQKCLELSIPIIEDVCESHGATFKGRKVGTFGLASNFSFYFAHHMSTIEGGMVSTNNEHLYETLRMFRSHGMVREIKSKDMQAELIHQHPDLNPQFIFKYPAYNFRSTELNAVLGRSQLKNLDANNKRRVENCNLFYKKLDPKKYRTDFDFEGAVNYAFVLVMREKDDNQRQKITNALDKAKVEYRRGTSGGGNQLRQPYLMEALGRFDLSKYPEVEHIHFYGFYIGNYPTLDNNKIRGLVELLNTL